MANTVLVGLCGNTMYIYYCKAFDHKLGSASIGTDEDLSLQIESVAIINIHGVSTKLNE